MYSYDMEYRLTVRWTVSILYLGEKSYFSNGSAAAAERLLRLFYTFHTTLNRLNFSAVQPPSSRYRVEHHNNLKWMNTKLLWWTKCGFILTVLIFARLQDTKIDNFLHSIKIFIIYIIPTCFMFACHYCCSRYWSLWFYYTIEFPDVSRYSFNLWKQTMRIVYFSLVQSCCAIIGCSQWVPYYIIYILAKAFNILYTVQ